MATTTSEGSAVYGEVDVDNDPDLHQRVVLSVGGRRFETYSSTLSAYPDTLLGAMFSTRNRHLRRPDAAGEYFFDRDPRLFEHILNFYRVGKIFMPSDISSESLKEELAYFHLPLQDSDPPCEVFTFGKGEYGQLGTGDRASNPMPQRVDVLVGLCVRKLSLGTSHSACLVEDGRVFSWGYGGDGRLGHGHDGDVLVPKPIAGLHGMDIEVVVCGELHTAALTNKGQVFTWGLGKDGRLGHGARDSEFVPRLVSALSNKTITQVACGGLHTAVLTSTGTVETFGLGKDGRLGHGNLEPDQLSPRIVQGLTDHIIKQVDCGGHHTAALTENGVVYTFGFDDDGRLGHGTVGHQFHPRVVDALVGEEIAQVACGCWHSAALSTSGAVFTFGSCKSGQLGGGQKSSVSSPRVVLQGKGGGIVSIACGTAHTAALSASGELYTWGKHADGRLGYVNTAEEDQPIPRRVVALDGKLVRQVVCGVYDTGVVVGGPRMVNPVRPLSEHGL